MHLVAQEVAKHYRNKRYALKSITLKLASGVTGLLGPNGAGKSTLMRILATITRPSSGRVLWNDRDIQLDPDRLRTVLGYLPQDFGVYPHLNAWEFLKYLAVVKGIPAAAAHRRIDELLTMVNLAHSAKRPLSSYSGGMRQRVGIAQALLNDPLLLIVDEPTAGLDPEERIRFRNLLLELSGERIVILSTHIVADVEAIAAEIAILADGQLLAHELPQTLLQAAKGSVWEMVVAAADLPRLRTEQKVSSVAHRPDGVHVRIVSPSTPSDSAYSAEPTLEDAYLVALSRRRVADPAAQEAV